MILSTTTAFYLACAVLTANPVNHDPFEGAIQVFRYSFENEQDRDFDRQPDDWTRRKGSAFPFYVKAEIDPERGQDSSSQSLRFFVNGGPVVFYSPRVKTDDMHSYVFEGHIRTQLLTNDAAVLSLSFLNEKLQRVQRVTSRPVSGTHQDWARVRIGPISPVEGVRYVVIGCHLINGKKMDIHGGVWFDNLWLGKLPQLKLVSNFSTHFKQKNAKIEVTSHMSGLDQVLEFSTPIDADDGTDLTKKLDEGVIPVEIKQTFSDHKIILPDSASIRQDEEGGWRVSDGKKNYLILYEQSQFEVYDADSSYQLSMQIMDTSERVTGTITYELKAGHPRRRSGGVGGSQTKQGTKIWELPPHEYGFYLVNSTLKRNGKPVLTKNTAFSVLDLVTPRDQGEFGWSIQRDTREMPLEELADAAAQSGIRWLKFPLWRSMYLNEPAPAVEIADFFSLLTQRGITPIGLLNHPPDDLRNQFSQEWSGVSEVFTMPRNFWKPSLEPVLARYSSSVQHWQLGGDFDTSFIGLRTLSNTIHGIKKEFDQIGRNTQIVLPWDWEKPIPPNMNFANTSLFLTSKKPLNEAELISKLKETSRTAVSRSILLKPLARSQHSAGERGSDLAKKMIAAKIGGAEGIFAYDVFDEEHGLLEPNGAPSPLFLPWRTMALALQGAEFLGSFILPSNSRNFAFAHQDEVVLVIWNDKPKQEKLYLGEDALVTDIWGRQLPDELDLETRQQVLDIESTPLVVRKCSEPLARWRMATRFNTDRLASKHGPQPAEISIRNTFNQGVSGMATLNIPPEWQINTNGWTFRIAPGDSLTIPVQLTLPPNASLGDVTVSMDFDLSADRHYKFRVHRTFEVGLGDVQLTVQDRLRKDGSLEVIQTIYNNTNAPEEILEFNCSLRIPGRPRQKHRVTKLGQGKDRKFYLVPNGKTLKGRMLQIQAEEIGGRRILNKTWRIGKKWGEQNNTALPE